jgi:endo-1,3(4)-beta-glucanase
LFLLNLLQAVNAYYAVYLYALATQQADMQRFASAMLAMEIASVQAYWHMRDASIYDAVFAQSAMVGNIGALDVTASTWFGDNAEFVHGINL